MARQGQKRYKGFEDILTLGYKLFNVTNLLAAFYLEFPATMDAL